ncbi:hypothetical protein ABZ949_02480 [Micromonospora tulbaghiae]|uniref:hypothetical protein n=1 Tax=Micromonospora tulbaghiae TaxID=479978 RepID=UPI0033C79A73
MTGKLSFAALRAHHRCTEQMIADPELTGDLLLIGMWLSRATHLTLPAPAEEEGGTSRWTLDDIARDLFPLQTNPGMYFAGEWTSPQTTGPDVWRVVELLKNDIRRYDPAADRPGPAWARVPCSGPMVRRPVCGQPGQTWRYFTIPETGRKQVKGACRKHHDWFMAEWKANVAAVNAATVPVPPANVGGRLARHLPDIDWPALWVGLDPAWVAPPEVETSARPRLRLVVGSELPARPVAASRSPRPRFALIDGEQS